MNLYFRFFLLLLKRLASNEPITLLSACSTRFRVTPLDLDLNFHMNNGRYFSIMDLGRFDLLLRTKTFWRLAKKGYYPVVSSESIRFKKSLELLQSFDVVTKIEALDERDFYMSQTFIRGERVVAEGVIKGRFLQRGRKGSVPSRELFELVGMEYPEQLMTDRAKLQKQMEDALATQPAGSHPN